MNSVLIDISAFAVVGLGVMVFYFMVLGLYALLLSIALGRYSR